jgi:CSLREA domain-containing protein
VVRSRRVVAFVIILVASLLTLPASPAGADADFTVNTTDWTSDANPGDDVCDVDPGTSGDQCSLRAAVEEANADIGFDRITFEGLSSGTIEPTGTIGITTVMTIDARTATGYAGAGHPVIEISGAGTGTGIQIAPGVSGVVVDGLAINGFATHVQMDGDDGLLANSFIGTDPTGSTDAGPDSSYGVIVTGAGNVVSDGVASGMGYGIVVSAASTATTIVGNKIGTDAAGESPVSNQYQGVSVDGPADVTIGDGTVAGRNVISGNSISGVSASASSAAVLLGNHLGLDADGDTAIANGAYGVIFYGGGQIGDGTAGGRNVISGNGQAGVFLAGSDATVAGNYIGTDASGLTSIGNGVAPLDGLAEASVVLGGGSENNVVGGVNGTPGGGCTGDCNVIAGGLRADVSIQGGDFNIVAGNHIGIDVDGESAFPAPDGIGWGRNGVLVGGAGGAEEGNVIGGPTAGEMNAIPLYNDAAIFIYPGPSPTAPNVVQGNRIGTDAAGTSVPTEGSIGASVQGPAIVEGNQFGAGGLYVGGDVTVESNLIGTDPTGMIDLGSNIDIGIYATDGSPTIGTPGAGNTIVGVDTGVSVANNATASIRGNVMRDIDLIPIELRDDLGGSAGVSPNDADDTDTGSNGMQNFPMLSSATREGGQLRVVGSLISTGSTTYDIDVYSSDSLAPAGHGEAWTYLGSFQVTTDDSGVNGSGTVVFDEFVSEPPTGQDVVTATATGPDGSTSEFSVATGVETGNVAHTFTVDSNSDVSDELIGDGVCATDGSGCTLRAAIQEANASVGRDRIAFDLGLGNRTIEPGGNLPTISGRTIIDGRSEGGVGYTGPPLVELKGTNITPSQYGNILLTVTSPTEINGLIINSVPTSGTGIFSLSGGLVVRGNYLGTDTTGTIDETSGTFGIFTYGTGTVVGGLNPTPGSACTGDCNLIGGWAQGIQFNGNDNTASGNFIGTDVSGTATIPNVQPGFADGVGIAAYGERNIIGGGVAGYRNLISGNNVGIRMTWESRDNVIQGNFIGTTASGNGDLGNGIGIQQWYGYAGARNNLIGGDSDSLGGSCTAPCNLISGNGTQIEFGFFDQGPDGNVIKGNFIGTDVTGTASISGGAGIAIGGQTEDTIVGGSTPGEGNLISGNDGNAMVEQPWYDCTSGCVNLVHARGTIVEGNRIGTTTTGTVALPNGGGVGVTGGIVGGPSGATEGSCDGPCNLISASDPTGCCGGGLSAGLGTVVQGNMIGTDITGTADLGNRRYGVSVGDDVVLGGTGPGEGNLISGNGPDGDPQPSGYGVWLQGTGATVQGNLIGTAAEGLTPLPNQGFPNAFYSAGIYVRGTGNTIGGVTPAAANVISGNEGAGIAVFGLFAGQGDDNLIRGNLIGVGIDGTTPVPNGHVGVSVQYATDNQIGGTQPGAGNVIAQNNSTGVDVLGDVNSGRATGTSILGNSIVGNAGPGILVYEETYEEPAPVVTGFANDLSGDGTVSVGLGDAVDGDHRIEVFVSQTCDSSGAGEGQLFAGAATLSVEGGSGTAVVDVPGGVDMNAIVTSTATAPDGSTSEFSTCYDQADPSISVVHDAPATAESGELVVHDIQVENLGVEPVTLTALTDDVSGNLAGQGSCAVGSIIPVGGSYSCSFSRLISGTPGTVDASIVTATAEDDDGNQDTAGDDATVAIAGDEEGPVITGSSLNPYRVASTGSFVLDVTGTDNVGVTQAEYWLGDGSADPGAGNGTSFDPHDGAVIEAEDTPGDHEYSYRIGDAAGNWSEIQTASITVDDTMQSAIATVAAGQTLSTDPGRSGPSPTDQVTTDITIPSGGVAGHVNIDESEACGFCEIPGYVLFGQQVDITAPAQTVSDPLVLTFRVFTVDPFEVFRGAVQVMDCAGPGADPNPCVESVDVSGGATTVVVRTSHASTWGFAAPDTGTTEIIVDHTTDPDRIDEPGGVSVRHQVMVTNTGTRNVVLTSLEDSLYGPLDGVGDCAVSVSIVVGESYTCAFEVQVSGDADDLIDSIVTAVASGPGGSTATGSDLARVRILDVQYPLQVSLSADRASLPTTGGVLTYTAVVTNSFLDGIELDFANSQEAGGDVLSSCDRTSLAPSEVATCTYEVTIAGGSEGDVVTEYFDVGGADSDGRSNQERAYLEIPITDAQADLAVSLISNPPVEVEEGGYVEWQITVTNLGPDPASGVVVGHALDPDETFFTSVPGGACDVNVDGSGTCAIGQIASGGTASVSIVTIAPADATATPVLTATSSIASSTSVDPNDANDQATDSVALIEDNPLQESVFVPPEEPAEVSTATTTAPNGDGVATGADSAVIDADLPAGGDGGVMTLEEQTCSQLPCSGSQRIQSSDATMGSKTTSRLSTAAAKPPKPPKTLLGNKAFFVDPPAGYGSSNPVVLTLWYDKTLLIPSGAYLPVLAKDDGTILDPLPKCKKGVPLPCYVSVTRVTSTDPRVNGDLRMVVKITSEDPTVGGRLK